MIVELTEEGFFINYFRIENKQTGYAEAIEVLGTNFRKVSLNYGITLIVFDRDGIRMWVKDDKITQLQIVLSDRKLGDKFPANTYQGQIKVNGKELKLPVDLDQINQTKEKYVWDDDSKQYGVNMLYLFLGKYKFPFQFDSEARFVENISS